MNSKARKVRLTVFLVIIIASAVLWWVFGSGSADLPQDISTSGFIEARDVAISMVYDQNDVLGIVQKGGETRFVCKA